MTTILLDKTKKRLKKDYFLRFLNLKISMLILVSIVWLIMYGFTYYTTLIAEKPFDIELNNQKNQSSDTLISSYKERLVKANSIASVFNTNIQSKSEILNFILDSRISGIEYQVISVIPIEESFLVNLSGIASNRDRLINFKAILEQNKSVGKFDLPLSNFTKNTDIPFTLNFSYKKS